MIATGPRAKLRRVDGYLILETVAPRDPRGGRAGPLRVRARELGERRDPQASDRGASHGLPAALTELNKAHRRVADETDLELDAETRDAAMWLICGRCLGLANAACHLASGGYSSEVVPVLRSLHEATRLLAVFSLSGEDRLMVQWLRGKNVSRGDIMAANDRQEEAVRAEMADHGVAPGDGGSRDYFEGQYGRWSEFAHHRRRHLLDQVSVPARMMPVGRHPDWRSRAALVDHLGWSVVELVSVGGSVLAQLWGPEWEIDRFQPTFRALLDFKDQIPLADIARGEASDTTFPSDGT